MHSVSFLCLLALSISARAVAAPSAEAPRVMAVAKPIPIGLEGGSKSPLRVTDSQILLLEPAFDNGEATVLGLRTGFAEVLLLDTEGAVVRRIPFQVVNGDTYRRYLAIHELLGSVPGITVTAIDRMVVIEGKPENALDVKRIFDVEAHYVDDVLNLAVDDSNLCQERTCERAFALPAPAKAEALASSPAATPSERQVASAAEDPALSDAQLEAERFEKQIEALKQKAARTLASLREHMGGHERSGARHALDAKIKEFNPKYVPPEEPAEDAAPPKKRMPKRVAPVPAN